MKILPNCNMNDAGISDQCRGNCRFYLWCRNIKWRVSLCFLVQWKHERHFFHLRATSYYNFWLSCNESSSRKHLHYSCEFQHFAALALIYLEGKVHDMLSCGTIKNFRIKRTGAANYAHMSRVVETTQNCLQCARATDKTLDPDEGVISTRLVKELNHFPKLETLSHARTKFCDLHRYANRKQVHSRAICCSVRDAHLCAPCYHVFHATNAAK